MQILLIFSLVIAVLAVLFAVQNNQPVTVRFLLWSIQSTSALVILVSILAGVLISLFASSPSMVRNKLNLRSQRKRIGELESELSATQTKLAAAEQQLSAPPPGAVEVTAPPEAPPPAPESQTG
jgi:uncharacterized integral membrane protein